MTRDTGFITGAVIYIMGIVAFLGVVFQNLHQDEARVKIEVLSRNKQDWTNDFKRELSEFISCYENYKLLLVGVASQEKDLNLQTCAYRIDYNLKKYDLLDRGRKKVIYHFNYLNLLLSEGGRDSDVGRSGSVDSLILNLEELMNSAENTKSIRELQDKIIDLGKEIVDIEWKSINRL